MANAAARKGIRDISSDRSMSEPLATSTYVGGVASPVDDPFVDLTVAARVIHPKRGPGRVVGVDQTADVAKPFSIRFDLAAIESAGIHS